MALSTITKPNQTAQRLGMFPMPNGAGGLDEHQETLEGTVHARQGRPRGRTRLVPTPRMVTAGPSQLLGKCF